ncbi:poly [ADP-ribose] polymerase 2-A [Phalaenopsis equestris]|uniref:poly [ADP-ribose] polymerase 2-A n=1 Tax=Phalaenopsis equestris TaxID=78828 RepID=UPI0009E267C2|nr:poly [ADP-ribose] polymerase 2-A [Phalaenopsis equestris]
MASKLKVDELRAKLSLRGLDTTGTKPILVKRLEAALQSEEEKEKEADPDEAVPASGVSNGPGKRKRSSDDDAVDREEEVCLEKEKLVKYTVRELKDLAARCGVSATGTKMELVKRLSGVAEIPKGTVEEVAVEEIEEERLVTATRKGGAVLDQWLPDYIKTSFHVLQNGGDFYDATLNQTNVGDNNNKFYIIQALESDDGFKFMVYSRWGRVGVRGQDKLHGPFTRETAIREFEVKFFEKTKNRWSDRKNFICHPKCYTLLEMDYSEAGEEQVVPKPIKSVDTQLRETKLDGRIAKFISVICNVSMMKQQMLEIGYNAEKLPLGKLSQSTILKGYDVLRRISDVIGKADRKKLEQLSGEFYTVIPHDFGFKKMREFVIDTPHKLKSKLDMVSALGEIEIATKILKDDADSLEDPLYSHYQHLCCELNPVEINSKEFLMVQKYLKNTHAETHSGYTVDIIHLFSVSRKGEAERFRKFSDVQNRMLLWHGSRLTNWTGILSQGLRIAPPEAPVTGYMFGKGVYFADMFSKSANYCCTSPESSSGVLLLCEVALGDMAELLNANCHAHLLPEGKLSTKGVGGTAPNMSQAEILEDGLVVPLGKPKEQDGPQGCLLYNEYIVYNVEQIRMRYVLHVNFNYNY